MLGRTRPEAAGLFGDDGDFEGDSDVAVQFDRHVVLADSLDGVEEADLALVQLDAEVALDRLGDVARCDAAVQAAVLAGLHGEGDGLVVELLRRPVGLRPQPLGAALFQGVFGLEVFERAARRLDGEFTGVQVVAGVAVGDGDDLALFALVSDVLQQYDFHGAFFLCVSC